MKSRTAQALVLSLMALPLCTGGPLRADFISWSFTARVILYDDAGRRVPGLQAGTLLTGDIRYDDGAAGVGAPPPASGLTYPGAGGAIDFAVGGVHLGSGSTPATLTVGRGAPNPGFPPPPFAFGMGAFNSTPTSYLDAGFGMYKHVGPNTPFDFSLKGLLLDFNHFDGGYVFYNYNAGGPVPVVGSASQLLVEAQLVSITAGPAVRQAPEPAALTLCGLGGVTLSGLWRRRRRANQGR